MNFFLQEEEDSQPSNDPDELAGGGGLGFSHPLIFNHLKPGHTVHVHASDKPQPTQPPPNPVAQLSMQVWNIPFNLLNLIELLHVASFVKSILNVLKDELSSQ